MEKPQERPLSALDAIFTRRSVRHYTPHKLDAATIRSLLDAAVQAPSAMHLEPWAFVVIQDHKTLERLSERAKETWAREAAHYRDLHRGREQALAERFASADFNIFYDAPALIAICARPLGPFVAADCWLAAENIMLAAAAIGLGTCCIGSAIPALNRADTKAELGIPADIEVVAPIVVGVPGEAARDVTRKEPFILSWK